MLCAAIIVIRNMAPLRGGRPKDNVRDCYDVTPVVHVGRSTQLLKCRGCNQGVTDCVVRLKNHASHCKKLRQMGPWTVLGPVANANKQRQLNVVRTSKPIGEDLNQAVARFIFSANLPFTTLKCACVIANPSQPFYLGTLISSSCWRPCGLASSH